MEFKTKDVEKLDTLGLVTEAIRASEELERRSRVSVQNGIGRDEATIIDYVGQITLEAEKRAQREHYIMQLAKQIEQTGGIANDGTISEVAIAEARARAAAKDGKFDCTHIKDSGERTSFESGAVRDMHEGKGRFDLMPLAETLNAFGIDDKVLDYILDYTAKGGAQYLEWAIQEFVGKIQSDRYNYMLGLAKHYEQGAVKYGENNWQKGIPTKSYIDSAIRHYCKHMAGQTDERHDVEFLWNIISAIWTCEHKPEYNSYAKGENEE